jgi:hypothetical protein
MTVRAWIVLVVAGMLALLVAPVLAQPYGGPGGGPGWAGPQPTGRPLTMAEAETIARQVLDRTGNAGLALDEIQEFSNNFYVAVKYKAGGQGALEFLIDRYTGWVHPEPQTMMWNTQFGRMAGYGPGGTTGGYGRGYGPGGMMGGSGYGHGPGMMGGSGPGGMMGGSGYGYGPGGGPGPGAAPAVAPQVTAAQAKSIAQKFLDIQFPGTKAGSVDAFPGYYTLDITRDGKVVGMMSVNGYTGQVWYHSWHGTFIAEKELR